MVGFRRSQAGGVWSRFANESAERGSLRQIARMSIPLVEDDHADNGPRAATAIRLFGASQHANVQTWPLCSKIPSRRADSNR